MSDAAIGKYLARYAEPEAASLRSPEGVEHLNRHLGDLRVWQSAVVVPAYREELTFLDGLCVAASASSAGRVLTIVVANAPRDASAADVEWGERFLSGFRATCENWTRLVRDDANTPPLFAGTLAELDVILVDRRAAGYRLAREHGVGLARKIGNDVALALWSQRRVLTPWIFQLDADATPPLDYFTQPLPEAEGAAVFPFSHVRGNDELTYVATLKHEAWLRYHVLGLRWAGSRYAWHAIGSCMAVHARTLAIVRGFPKRNAAEDFHLLQKVCKVAPVHRLQGAPVRITSRRSDRAPVGTGAAVARALDDPDVFLDNPECYAILKAWLEQMERFTHTLDVRDLQEAVARFDSRQIALGELRAMGCFDRFAVLSSETTSQPDLSRRVHDWFDGIKALHLIHGLRRAGWIKVAASRALALAPFTSLPGPVQLDDSADWRRACDFLARLEQPSASGDAPGA